MTYFSDETPLGDARKWIHDQAFEEGAKCPCCHQFYKAYTRTITADCARGLIIMFRRAGTEFQYTPNIDNSGSISKLRYWGLIEMDPEQGRGWWRVLPRGVEFIKRRIRVQKYVVLLDNEFLEYIHGDRIDIVDALGNKFDYDELMKLNTRERLPEG